MKNLDLACAELGSKLGQYKDDEKLLTDALGVIEEQGVYAFFLFLEARGKGPGKETSKVCANFLHAQGLLQNGDGVLDALKKDVATKLDTLLFARDLLRQSLIYARYHAKASEEERPRQQHQSGRPRQSDGGARRQNRNNRERNRGGGQGGARA